MTTVINKNRIIIDYFNKKFRFFKWNPSSKKLVANFIEQWMQLLQVYSNSFGFVNFDPDIPILPHLVSKPKGILIVMYLKQFHLYRIRQSTKVSIFPLFPFRVIFSHTEKRCDNLFYLLCDYIEMSGVQIIGFHKVFQHEKYIEQLKEKFPTICIYGPKSIDSFFRVISSS